LPVEGQGLCFLNAPVAARDRWILPVGVRAQLVHFVAGARLVVAAGAFELVRVLALERDEECEPEVERAAAGVASPAAIRSSERNRIFNLVGVLRVEL